jgi:Phage integrase, N-terminal SAM-like domain
MGIYLREKKWYVDVPDGKGRRIRRSVGPSKDIADLVHKDLQVKIAKYLGIFETATTPFSEYAKEWLAKRKPTLKPSTYRDYSSIMEVYAIPHLGETPIGKVSRRDVEIFFDKLWGSPGFVDTPKGKGIIPWEVCHGGRAKEVHEGIQG